MLWIDTLMPHGILRRADVADVTALATGPGPAKLLPALMVELQATVAELDRAPSWCRRSQALRRCLVAKLPVRCR
jgi:putative intracellular protease/amidase